MSTGALPSTYGVGAWGAQGSSKNYKRPLGREAGRVLNSAHFNHPTGRTTGGNSYSGGFRPGHGDLPGARAVRSAGYGQGKLHPAPMGVWQPRAPFHTGTPANLQRPAFDNWSAKKASCQGEMGHKSAIVYWGDLRARDEKMRAMRLKYPLNQERRALIQDAFSKLDRDGDGLVTLQDLRDNGYNAKSHPRYLAAAPNHWTEEQVFMNVIARFKMGEYEPGTTHKFSSITYDEFEEYYRVVGEELDDEYFGAMMAQAWRLQRRAPGMQGWDAQVLSHLALVEANMMGDGYLGKEALDKSKLSAITVSSDDAGQMATWKSMVESGEYSQMMRAAEALDKYVGQEESFDAYIHVCRWGHDRHQEWRWRHLWRHWRHSKGRPARSRPRLGAVCIRAQGCRGRESLPAAHAGVSLTLARQLPVTDDWSLDTGHTRAMTCARMWWSAPVGSRCAPNSLYGACFL